jgi:hypothetical protein
MGQDFVRSPPSLALEVIDTNGPYREVEKVEEEHEKQPEQQEEEEEKEKVTIYNFMQHTDEPTS